VVLVFIKVKGRSATGGDYGSREAGGRFGVWRGVRMEMRVDGRGGLVEYCGNEFCRIGRKRLAAVVGEGVNNAAFFDSSRGGTEGHAIEGQILGLRNGVM